MLKLPLLAARLFDQPLMIQDMKLDQIINVLKPRLTGAVTTMDSGSSGNTTSISYAVGNVMVIPIIGTLVQRSSSLDAASGLVSYQTIAAELQTALANPSVQSVLFDIDSGGGEVAGCFDLVDAIYHARGTKPMWAIANEMAASAAYALASAADKIITTRTAITGSVGVVAAHIDQSQYDKQQGLKWTFVYAGAEKTTLNPHEPLSASGTQTLQQLVNTTYDLFIQTVARNRSMDPNAIASTEAQIYRGADAVNVGLADEIMSFETTIAAMNAGHFQTQNQKITLLKPERTNTMKAKTEQPPVNQTDPAAPATEETPAPTPAPAEQENKTDEAPAPAPESAVSTIATTTKINAAVSQERERASTIIKQAAALGVSADFANTLIVDGVDQATASARLIDRAAQNDPARSINSSHTTSSESVDSSAAPLEDRCKAEWDRNPTLRAEFSDNFAGYLAFEKASAAGQVKLKSKKA